MISFLSLGKGRSRTHARVDVKLRVAQSASLVDTRGRAQAHVA